MFAIAQSLSCQDLLTYCVEFILLNLDAILVENTVNDFDLIMSSFQCAYECDQHIGTKKSVNQSKYSECDNSSTKYSDSITVGYKASHKTSSNSIRKLKGIHFIYVHQQS